MSERIRIGYRDFVRASAVQLQYDQDRSKILVPCQRITDPNLLVGVLGGARLQTNRFLVSGKDRQPIRLTDTQSGTVYETTNPGKSAFLYFGESPNKSLRPKLAEQHLKRPATRSDHLHLTTVEWIEEVMWQAWWTPLPERDHWLHVRLIANSTIERATDPTPEDAQALSEAFVKIF